MTKACFKCGETKPLSDFYRHPQMGDGHLNKCKDCAKIDARQHRQDNANKVRAHDRERGRQPHRLAERRDRFERERQLYPERFKARNALSNAVRDGKVQKRPCAFCGQTKGLEAHHHDYAKPLDVTWLCRPCHRRFHALERMATYRAGEAA